MKVSSALMGRHIAGHRIEDGLLQLARKLEAARVEECERSWRSMSRSKSLSSLKRVSSTICMGVVKKADQAALVLDDALELVAFGAVR